jgi:hypothetical protein
MRGSACLSPFLLCSAPMASMLTRMEMRAVRCTRHDEMNSGEDERLRGDDDDAITLGVRTYLCTMPLPCTYLPRRQVERCAARSSFCHRDSGWFARSFTDAQAASLAQATSIYAAAAARTKKKNISGLLALLLPTRHFLASASHARSVGPCGKSRDEACNTARRTGVYYVYQVCRRFVTMAIARRCIFRLRYTTKTDRPYYILAK